MSTTVERLIGPPSASVRTILVASLVGTTVEWYDFFLYATAAGLVFPKLFFPVGNDVAATLLAFGTFAVGFVARPIGGVLFGLERRFTGPPWTGGPLPGDTSDMSAPLLLARRRHVDFLLVCSCGCQPSRR